MAALSCQCKINLASSLRTPTSAFQQRRSTVAFPQRKISVRAEELGKEFTGYIEKDTAGQENIYAVEPTIYVAESVFSSGSKGSNEGSAVVVNILGAVAALAGAVAALIALNSSGPAAPDAAYSGPPLSSYIAKFEGELAAAPVTAPSVAQE
eukprot:TRINITY_DN35346_c0_g1_i1.p1 TRINITY_DN35346_c0_g1~~TRINITY_DN35346_c0_g1_i1.p1  ORF type:complete len:152 (+),score=12.68 TRINITY_DN35346_c0_g1_i1:90-545(+)